MKKIIAMLTALALTGVMLTGCGDTKTSPKSDASKAASETSEEESSAAETDNDTRDSSEETEEPTGDDSKATISVPTSDMEYETAIREFFDAQNNGDYDKLVRCMYPERIVDVLYNMSGLDAAGIAEQVGADTHKYEITSITEEGTMPDDVLEELMNSFDQMAVYVDALEGFDGDMENITDEEREQVLRAIEEAFSQENNSGEHYYTITKAYDVTVSYLDNGEPDEDYFYVYYIEGEGWKLDNSMRKYVKKAKQASANADAKMIFSACYTALTMLEVEGGADISGSYIISSDDSKNIRVPYSINVGDIRAEIEGYLSESAEKYDYFIIVHNGECVYTAMSRKDREGVTGCYPVNCIPKGLVENEFMTESADIDDYTLDKLYEIAKRIIG